MQLQDRVLVIPDAQVPEHDLNSWKTVLNFCKYYKPTEIIILGDFCNLNSLSRYQLLSERESISLDYEIALTNDELDKLPSKPRKVYIMGNHEQRYQIYKLNEWVKEVRHKREFTSIEEELYLKKRGYKIIPYGQVYQKGHALFTHGWYISKYHAQKTLTRFFKNIYYGHTHNWQAHSVLGIDGKPVEAVSCGCICKTDMTYLKGAPPDWVQMFAYFDFMKDRTYYPHFAKIINGHTYELGREF